MNAATLPEFLRSELSRLGVPAEERLIVACSGGKDSTALAHALHARLKQSVLLAHIDHGIREDDSRRAECSIVDRLGRILQVPIERRVVPPGRIRDLARREGRSLEEVAREVRYALLSEIARAAAPPVTILTAHHSGDQLETMLMRLLGGRSLFDFSLIEERRELGESSVTLVRPLLRVSPEVLKEYHEVYDLPSLDDPSNQDLRYLRNSVRHTIVPVVKRLYSPKTLSRTVPRFSRDLAALRRALEELIPDDARGVYGTDRWYVERDPFLRLPEGAREIVLRKALYHYAETGRIPFAPFREALVTRRDTAAAGLRLLWSDRVVEVTRDVVRTGARGYLWVLDGAEDCVVIGDDGRVRVMTDVSARPGRFTIGPVCSPVIVRPLRAGERVRHGGTVRDVRHLLENSGVSRKERDESPVLEDGTGFVTFLHRTGPLSTRDGIECIQDGNTERPGFVSLGVRYEDRNAERR